MKITKKQLKEDSHKGEWVYFHEKDNKNQEYRGLCVDEVVEISGDYAHRLQKIIWCQEYDTKNKRWVNWNKYYWHIGIRACYWVITKKRNSIGFGQYCMNSDQKLVGLLFKRANKKGFFKPMSYFQMKKEVSRFDI